MEIPALEGESTLKINVEKIVTIKKIFTTQIVDSRNESWGHRLPKLLKMLEAVHRITKSAVDAIFNGARERFFSFPYFKVRLMQLFLIPLPSALAHTPRDILHNDQLEIYFTTRHT